MEEPSFQFSTRGAAMPIVLAADRIVLQNWQKVLFFLALSVCRRLRVDDGPLGN